MGDRDIYGPPPQTGPKMHDWIMANKNMAKVPAADGYHYQLVFLRGMRDTDRAVRAHILRRLWSMRGRAIRSQGRRTEVSCVAPLG